MTTPVTVQCFTPVRGRRMRLTKLDNCGRPVPGACSAVITRGFVTATVSGEIDEGEEIEVKNAAGETCVSVPPCPSYKWTNAEVEFCGVNPALATLINPNWRMLRNAAGSGIGYAVNRKFACEGGFALEIWTDVADAGDVCDNPDAQGAWGYLLLPWMTNGFMSGDLEIANDAITFTYSAKSKINSRWGAGPYDVMLGDAGTAGPLLEPVESDEDYRLQLVDVAPPEDVCGCVELVLSARQAVAGTPGHYLPTGAPAPADAAALDAVTPSPDLDAWGAGEYVNLADGSTAYHWDGDEWIAGVAP